MNIWGIRGHVEGNSWIDRIGLRVLRALLPWVLLSGSLSTRGSNYWVRMRLVVLGRCRYASLGNHLDPLLLITRLFHPLLLLLHILIVIKGCLLWCAIPRLRSVHLRFESQFVLALLILIVFFRLVSLVNLLLVLWEGIELLETLRWRGYDSLRCRVLSFLLFEILSSLSDWCRGTGCLGWWLNLWNSFLDALKVKSSLGCHSDWFEGAFLHAFVIHNFAGMLSPHLLVYCSVSKPFECVDLGLPSFWVNGNMLLDIFPLGNLLPVLSSDCSGILVKLRLKLVLLTLSLNLFVLFLDLPDVLKAI